ncbi:hypothetical protein [Parageobacillus thermoglucosidasius]|uniref:Uncharacterized protein n=2 Tax=Anoxybacillaceae TaxID=3120669 RepID=A0A7U4DJI5_GEOS0|nr:hypothetical protein [Parageobacillus thermoglucosidasius]AEH46493.1 hypothetical protein Geoth_0457 [Parageobacillus thermoglucosidasius C56-YS93]RDE29559.1 hypothetical protein DV714_00765 [Parageobacillus thermoglucosidasius]RDE36204.1 hypothetical protein DV713_01020 [Parageobacillus thermoglucosidasius]GMO00018.1 hypothetical protein PthstB1num2_20570 [Parageobacillus thermoglucosidasius]
MVLSRTEGRMIMKTYRAVLAAITMLVSLVLFGCTHEETRSKKPGEESETRVKIPSDKELIAIIDDNLKAFDEGNVDKYMETIHTQSPLYEQSRKLVEEISKAYKLKTEISNVEVMEKSEKEAKVKFTQKTVKIEGPAFRDNEITGYHVLRPEKGTWKIYNTVMTKSVFLDENGNPLETNGQDGKNQIEQMDLKFDERKWVLDHFDSANGESIWEFVLEGESVENWTELYTIHRFEKMNSTVGLKSWLEAYKQALAEATNGHFTFHTFESTGQEEIYEFIVKDAKVQDDQHEVARLFAQGDDLYLVRYTKLGEAMPDKTRDEWIQRLKQFKAQK